MRVLFESGRFIVPVTPQLSTKDSMLRAGPCKDDLGLRSMPPSRLGKPGSAEDHGSHLMTALRRERDPLHVSEGEPGNREAGPATEVTQLVCGQIRIPSHLCPRPVCEPHTP